MRSFVAFARLAPGDRLPALIHAARRRLAGIEDPLSTPRRVAADRLALRRIASLAKCHGVTLPAAVAAQAAPFTRRTRKPGDPTMMQDCEQLTRTAARALEGIVRRLKEVGLYDVEIGRSMVAAGLSSWSKGVSAEAG